MNQAPEREALSPDHGPGRVYRFESFELDADARRLTRDGVEIVLQPRVFDLLLALLHAPGVLLTRDRLLAEVWSDTVVADSSLTQSISVLRRELEVGDRRLIRTIPRVGYRFEARVEVVARSTPSPRVASPDAEPETAVDRAPDAPSPGPTASEAPPESRAGAAVGRRRGALLAVVFLMAAVLAWRAPWRGDPDGAPTAPPSAEALDAYAKGLALVEQFQPRGARERLLAAVQSAPDFAPANLALARVLDELGQRVAAMRHAERALAASAGLTPADRQEAEALSLELKGDWPRACALREQSAKAPAAPVAATLGLANCLIRDARAHRASALLAQALPELQGAERWRAMLLDAQALIAQTKYAEAIARAREVAAAAAAMDARPLRARALTVEAEAGLLGGDLPGAARANGEAAALLSAMGDASGAAAAEQQGEVLTLMSSDPVRAETIVRGHLALAETVGDPVLAAHSKRLIAAALKAQGQLTASRRLLEQALSDFIALGDRQWQSKLQVNLALREHLDGDFDSAEARLRDALDAFPARGYGRWFLENELAYTLRFQGRYEEALRAAGAAYDAAHSELSDARQIEARCERGLSLSHLGRTAAAIEDLEACSGTAEPGRIADRRPASAASAGLRLALMASAAGDRAAARRAWDTAASRIETIGDPVVRGLVQADAVLAGLALDVDVDRLRALRPQVPAEVAVLRQRAALVDAWLQRAAGEPQWAKDLDATIAAIHPSNWSLRAVALLLAAARDRDQGRIDAGADLRAEAARRGDAFVLGQLDRLLEVAAPAR